MSSPKPLVATPRSDRCSAPVSKKPSFRSLRAIGLVLALASPAACTPEKPAETPASGGGPAATAASTATAAASAGDAKPNAPDPYVVQGPFTEEAFVAIDAAPLAAGALSLPASPAGVSAAPATCGDYLKAKPAAAPACADRASALVALDAVLAMPPATAFGAPAEADAAVKARDAALASLEGCAGLPSGLVRAVRIELLPVACGDVLAEPLLKKPPQDLRGDVHETLFALALSARFARAGGTAPALTAPFTRKRVEEHLKGPIAKWMKGVAGAVQDMSAAASRLRFYGGGVAAVAAGMADLTLVDTVRSAPIPDEFRKDEELKNIYYASLDEQLEPRKVRGRDAALVGLKRFAEVGVISDSRVTEARRLLSKLYGGRRVDALDRLMVPAPSAKPASTLEERLAQRLPTFYAGILLDVKLASQPQILAIFATQGVPHDHRRALREGSLSAELAPFVAEAHLALGRTYWRAADFETAAKAASMIPAASRTPSQKLLAALSIGLRGGPKDVVEMMIKSPLGMNGLGQRAALDALAAEAGPLSGAAAFDAAYLMEITAPERADGIFFKSVAKRYQGAAALLGDAKQKAEAEERAKAALAIAGEIK